MLPADGRGRIIDMTRVRRVLTLLARRAGVSVRHRVGRTAEFPEARDFAYCTDAEGAPPIIVTAPKLERQRIERIVGILAHECGHAALLQDHPDHREADADRVGSQIMGVPVRYDREAVETSGPGVRRPRWLPR